MAKKMTDDEINSFIKSKQVSAQDYKAPTVIRGGKESPSTTIKQATKTTSTSNNKTQKTTVAPTVTMKDFQTLANKNYEDKLSVFNKASEKYDKKRVEELNKRGLNQKMGSKIDIDYVRKNPQTSYGQGLKPYIEAQPEISKATENEFNAKRAAQNDYRYARYLKDYANVENEDVNLYDQTLGNFVRGVGDVFSTITDDNKYFDENGNAMYLPSYNDLKQAKVRESYGEGFGGDLARFGADVAHEGGKIVTTQGLNALLPYSGTALYFSDIYADQYKQNINEGYNDSQAMTDALLKSGQNYIKQRLIGGLGGKLTGNATPSWLEDTLTKSWGKLVSNPTAQTLLGSMTAEGIDEFTDTFIEAGIDAAVLGKEIDGEELLKEALYSGGVGAATGAFGGVDIRPNQNLNVTPNIDPNETVQLAQQQEPVIETKTPQIQTKPKTNINARETSQNVDTSLKPTKTRTQSMIDSVNAFNLQKNEQQKTKTSNKLLEKTTLENSRSREDISNRNINAFQYDNPQVKPYFRDAAYDLKEALNDYTTKGERYMREDGSWGGNKFSSTPEISELKNDYNMSYDQISKGIDGIIKDDGKENNAASKKVEVVIDKMLRKGYRSEFDELTNKPNQEYLDTLAGKQVDNKVTKQENEEDLPFWTDEDERKFQENQKKQEAKPKAEKKVKQKEEIRPTTKELSFEEQKKTDQIRKFRDAGMYASISKEQFLKNNYYPRLEQELGLTKEQAGKMFDNAKTKEYKQLYNKMNELYRNEEVEKYIPLEERGDLVYEAYNKDQTYEQMEQNLLNAINNRAGKEIVKPETKPKGKAMSLQELQSKLGVKETKEQKIADNTKALNLEKKETKTKQKGVISEGKRAEWTKTRDGVIEHMTKINNMFDGTNKELTDKQKLDLMNNALEMGGYEQLTELPSKQKTQKPKTQKVETKQEIKQQPKNIAEKKTSEELTIKNKEAAKKVAKNLNDTIKQDKGKVQDYQTLKRNIEKETGKQMRSWVGTSTKSTGTTELINNMNKEKITYEPTSNKKNLDAANRELAGLTYEQKVEKAKAILKSDKRIKSTDVALLETVIQEAQKEGKVNDFIELVQDTAILGTETGQVVQALSLIRQSDPLTQISTLQKLIEREQEKGNKVYQGVQIKEDLVEKVMSSYNEDGTWNQENFDNAMDELKQDIADQMHVRPTEKLNTWRYLSMLGNPKTHIRNIVANVAMSGLQTGKNKVAAGLEAVLPMNKLNKLLGGSETATRGKTLARSTQEVKNFTNETIDNYFKKHQTKSKYNETMGNLKGDIESRRNIFSEKTFVGKMLNKLERANSMALDIEDDVFNKAETKRAFSNFLTANGIETQADIDANPEIVAQALEYATFKGNEATFHQHSQTGTTLRNARESLRQGSNLTRIVGLGMDATLPFINTPINIAKTGIEYTPGLGMIKTISDVMNAPKDMKADVLIDSVSKQFVGGMLAAAGYALASGGYVNGKSGEEKDEKLEKNLGKQDYSLNLTINGKKHTFDLSWLSPSAMPLFVGVELYNATKGNAELSPELVMNILAKTIDPLSEMSVISSVTEALQSYSKGTQALQDIGTSAFVSYMSQYFPTLMGQVATLFDDKQRSSSGKTVTEKLINQLKYKTPGLRNTLPEQVDVWGEERKLSENPVQKALEAFFSPANRKEVKVDDTTKEIERIYDNTGAGLPSLSLTQSPKIDSDYVQLSSDEYIQYKKDYGKTSKELLDELMTLNDYKTANDSERKKMVSAIYEYSTYMARKKIADEKNIKYEYKQSDGTGYNYPKYYLSLSKEDFAKYVAKKYNEEDE